MFQTSPASPASGIIIINKPKGWTSHDVVNKVRRITGIKKIGHAGTLDPLATGVLILLVGSATKLSDKLLTQDKRYRAEISFGQQTDTGDADGQVIDTDDASWLTETEVAKILPLLEGHRQQTVPAYSAVKVKGQKLYNLARAGHIIVDRPIRDITISRIKLEKFEQIPPFPTLTITVDCSKGTYIRVLAEEIGDKLGTAAHLSGLERLASGPYTIEQAISIEQLSAASNPLQFIKAIDY